MNPHASDDILSRMADEMLAVEVRASWQRHLAGCPECYAKADAIRRAKETLQELPTVEANPLEQMQPPVFIPVVRPVFPWWGFAAGLGVGAMLISAFAVLRPIHLPMRVVSNGAELSPGQALNNSPPPGDIDLEISNQLSFRLKPGTTVSWQELDRLWLFGGRPNIVLNVMRGEVLARTHEKFWGSKLQIRTPTANATVKGTAFSVKVEPKEDATMLKVLAGSVFLSPYLNPVGIEVGSGRVGQVVGRRLTRETESLSAEERVQLLETYQLGKPSALALVVGGGPERVEELLEPALLYATIHPSLPVQPYVVVRVRELNRAILAGRLASAENNLRALETAVQQIHNPELAVPLRLFLGACNVRMGYPRRGCLHFQWVAVSAPQHPLASLALAAAGRTLEQFLHNHDGARTCFQDLLARYPKSPEADAARAFLRD